MKHFKWYGSFLFMRTFLLSLLMIISITACDQSKKPLPQEVESPANTTSTTAQKSHPDYITYNADLQKQRVRFFWKDPRGEHYERIDAVNKELAQQQTNLLYAVNGGIFQEDLTPLGLFIQDQKVQAPLNKRRGYGNFYVQPNGVFYITKQQKAGIVSTASFKQVSSITDAIQSGPMLLIDGLINPLFTKGSSNVNIRNGVGIKPDNTVVFSMSKRPVNFYDFANYFKTQGCVNALYLDGAISQSYCPEQDWKQTGGRFSVIIGVIEK
jgi:uncharacterized protein YigE (DUF2233 family)